MHTTSSSAGAGAPAPLPAQGGERTIAFAEAGSLYPRRARLVREVPA